MILNLKETTRKNTEQDWLKTNVARFTNMLQGQRDLITVARMILSELAPLVQAQQGVFYINEPASEGQPLLKLLASYAYRERKIVLEPVPRRAKAWSASARLKRSAFSSPTCRGDYIQASARAWAKPIRLNIVVLPVLFEG